MRILKKVIVAFLILLTVIAGSLYFFKNENAEENPQEKSNIDLKTQIEEFGFLGEEDPMKIKRIVKEKKMNDSSKIILYLQENNSLGYAILENSTMKYRGGGSGNEQSYTQYKNYLIIYGKKPNIDNKELQITLTTGDNYEDIEKTIPLDEGEYFLSINELPEDIEDFVIYSENYRYK